MKRKIFRFIIRILWIVSVSAAALIYISCPPTLDESLLLKVTDEIGPAIVISSPANGSSYSSSVVVEGTVADTTTEDGSPGTIRSLQFSVLSTELGDDVVWDDEGNFSFSFQTTGLSGSLTVQVSAADANGNVTTASLTLVDQGAFPSFSVVPRSKSALLTWDDVPLAQGYTLQYTDNGSYPSDQNGITLSDVTSPLTLENLENGKLHVFRVIAETSDGITNFSDYLSKIPLSSTTITPSLTEGYGTIGVEWNGIAGTDEFILWRGESKDSLTSYTQVRGTGFTDANVEDGITYSYAVSPALSSEVISEPVSGMTWPFPPASSGYSGGVLMSQCSDMDYEDGYVFAAQPNGMDPSNVHIIDVADPENPFIEYTITSDMDQMAVKVSGGYAYIVEYFYTYYSGTWPLNDHSALRIFDVSDPSGPVEVGSCEFDGTGEKYQFLGIDVDSTYAYVILRERASGEYRLKLFDISTKNSPQELTGGSGGEYVFPALTRDVSVEGNYVYVAVEDSTTPANSGLYVIDTTTPASPALAGSFNDPDLQKPRGLYVTGSTAYLADYNDGLRILDVTTPGSPTDEGIYHPGTGNGYDVKVIGNIAYLAMSSGGIYVLDISDYTSPILIRNYEVPNSAYFVDFSENYDAFVIDNLKGLRIFKINFPNDPELTGSYDTGFPAFKRMDAADGYVYMATSTSGFRVMDVSDPADPYPTGSYSTTEARSACILGDMAFIADGSEDLIILDISNPSDPSFVGGLDSGIGGSDLVVYGGYVYMAGGGGIGSFDVSDPADPVLADYWDIYGGVDIARKGTNLYLLSDGGAGDLLTVFDIATPGTPVKTGTAVLSNDNLYYMAVYGDYVYATGKNHGLHIINVSDPGAPVEVNTMYDTMDIFFRDIKIIENYAFIATRDSGLVILDLSEDPENPAEIGSFYPSGTTDNIITVDVLGNYVYYAEINSGDGARDFRVLRLGD